jgi:hypothetical protein
MEWQLLTRSRAATVLGLLVGALGIAILWASGVEFPIYPPPGIVILLADTLSVGSFAVVVGRYRRFTAEVGSPSPTRCMRIGSLPGLSYSRGRPLQLDRLGRPDTPDKRRGPV